jgi:hypothetical protein
MCGYGGDEGDDGRGNVGPLRDGKVNVMAMVFCCDVSVVMVSVCGIGDAVCEML